MLFEGINWKAMEGSMRAIAVKEDAITQNLANQDTPDYKQIDVVFKNVLEDKQKGVDVKTAEGTKYLFEAKAFSDSSRNILIDGNSVDTDQQQLELYAAYLQHSAIIQRMNSDFTKIRTVAHVQLS